MNKIDLNKCTPGQKLVSCHGLVLEYIRKIPDWYFPHLVRYPWDGYGTRTDDGQVVFKNKLPSDHDIVEILEDK